MINTLVQGVTKMKRVITLLIALAVSTSVLAETMTYCDQSGCHTCLVLRSPNGQITDMTCS